MAKKKTTPRAVKSATFKGDDLLMVLSALELSADIFRDMLDDTEQDPNARGCAAFDMEHCHQLIARIKGEK